MRPRGVNCNGWEVLGTCRATHVRSVNPTKSDLLEQTSGPKWPETALENLASAQ
jgi:hypothetical protein